MTPSGAYTIALEWIVMRSSKQALASVKASIPLAIRFGAPLQGEGRKAQPILKTYSRTLNPSSL